MNDIDLYDSAKAIIRSCGDIDAVMTVMENAEDSDDDGVQMACLAAARCALASIVTEIRAESEAITEKAAAETA